MNKLLLLACLAISQSAFANPVFNDSADMGGMPLNYPVFRDSTDNKIFYHLPGSFGVCGLDMKNAEFVFNSFKQNGETWASVQFNLCLELNPTLGNEVAKVRRWLQKQEPTSKVVPLTLGNPIWEKLETPFPAEIYGPVDFHCSSVFPFELTQKVSCQIAARGENTVRLLKRSMIDDYGLIIAVNLRFSIRGNWKDETGKMMPYQQGYIAPISVNGFGGDQSVYHEY